MTITESAQQPESGVTVIFPAPLTRCNRKGEVYTRTQEVQEQIASAVLQDWRTVSARALVADKSSSLYLQEESLVYLVREAHRQKEDVALRSIFAALHRRCVKYVECHLSSLPRHRVEDTFQNVIRQVIEKIMDLSNDAGDFFQVRFWVVLKRIMLTEYDKQVKELEEDEALVDIDAQVEGEEGVEPCLDLPDSSISQEDLVILTDGLSTLNGRLRKVFILRHYEGWPIKSNDVEEKTLSSYFNVTPRTIQNWLELAEATLVKWREGKRK